MSGRSAIPTAVAMAVLICLLLSGCRPQTDHPNADGDQLATPNIEATVQAALSSLEESRPSISADSVESTPLPQRRAAPTAVLTVAPPPGLSMDPTPTPPPRPVSATAAAPNLPPTQVIEPTATLAASAQAIPTATPDGADKRPPAPMFAGTFMDGNDYRLEDTVGTPTLLMFWAPW